MEDLLVTIVTFEKLHVGCFVKEKFDFEGIECFLTDEGIKNTDTDISQGIKLKVRANESEKAIRALMQIHKEYDLDKIEQDSGIKDKKKILVPVDISGYSINACKYAFGIAEKTDAEVKLLCVYEDPTLTGSVKHTTSWQKHKKIEAAELNKLLDIVSPFNTKIYCIHIDIKNDPLKQGKVDELNQYLEKEYNKYNIQCKLLESSDVMKGLEGFIEKYNIDWVSFSNSKRSLFYKLFHPNKLKEMISTSKIPMLVFPV